MRSPTCLSGGLGVSPERLDALARWPLSPQHGRTVVSREGSEDLSSISLHDPDKLHHEGPLEKDSVASDQAARGQYLAKPQTRVDQLTLAVVIENATFSPLHRLDPVHITELWQGLLGRPASESGSLCHGGRGHEGGDRRRTVLMLAIL